MKLRRFENLTPEKETGSVYTPVGMARDLSGAILSNLEITNSLSVLDPAAGDGRLLREMLNRLNPRSDIRVVAYELDPDVLRKTSNDLTKEFPRVDFSFRNEDMIRAFLDGHLMGEQFDIVIANPPYLRTQIMGAEKSKKLAKLFKLRGRLDIYYVFVLIAQELLSDTGVAGFVTSNRFMKVKSGASLRDYLLSHAELLEIIDYGDTKLFDAAVLPCTFVFKRGTTDPEAVNFYSIYCQQKRSGSAPGAEFPYDLIRTSDELKSGGSKYDVQTGSLLVNEIVKR